MSNLKGTQLFAKQLMLEAFDDLSLWGQFRFAIALRMSNLAWRIGGSHFNVFMIRLMTEPSPYDRTESDVDGTDCAHG